MENTQEYQKAKKKVQARIGFKIHLAVYLVVNAILISVNLIKSPDTLWFIWPLMGWGIAIFWHAMGVFVFNTESGVTERMIRKEMDKQLSKKN
ncbi:2TM domain-containing protein [Arenibacter sp. F26102]|uniref:2TM domain-containing protein n=1 Tax=Arenibacter sp. F26102 TaxID=2926416 RepID=UPI001FF54A8D|nr:2TM domain-containing protein [Arenibacter sp. F26102]MCK0146840.1 2TM domain-containing protein [Arenibacter sp. F26102]